MSMLTRKGTYGNGKRQSWKVILAMRKSPITKGSRILWFYSQEMSRRHKLHRKKVDWWWSRAKGWGGREWEGPLSRDRVSFWRTEVKVKVAQLCPTLWDPMGYTVHGILQARILEWVAFRFSKGSSQPRDRTQVSCIVGRFFTNWATEEA